jgi:hypothetical protein
MKEERCTYNLKNMDNLKYLMEIWESVHGSRTVGFMEKMY